MNSLLNKPKAKDVLLRKLALTSYRDKFALVDECVVDWGFAKATVTQAITVLEKKDQVIVDNYKGIKITERGLMALEKIAKG